VRTISAVVAVVHGIRALPAHRKKFGGGGARKFRLARRRAAVFPAAAARIRFRLARRRNSAADRSTFRLINDLLEIFLAHKMWTNGQMTFADFYNTD
jgi:hypothetical protein